MVLYHNFKILGTNLNKIFFNKNCLFVAVIFLYTKFVSVKLTNTNLASNDGHQKDGMKQV